jgi:hypothetical protein
VEVNVEVNFVLTRPHHFDISFRDLSNIFPFQSKVFSFSALFGALWQLLAKFADLPAVSVDLLRD